MKAVFEIAPKNIDDIVSKQYTLSIGLRPDGFCFTIYSPFEHSVLGMWHYGVAGAEDLETIWKSDEFLRLPFAKTFVMVEEQRWTLLPDGFVSSQSADDVWRLTFGADPDVSMPVQTCTISGTDIQCLYECPKTWMQMVETCCPDAELMCDVAVLLPRVFKQSLCTMRPVMFCHLMNKTMDLFVAEHGRLLMANQFAMENNNDFLYYTLNAYRSFSLDQNTDNLFLTGRVTDHDERIKSVERYIHNVLLENIVEDLPSENILTKLENKYDYFNLINLSLCE